MKTFLKALVCAMFLPQISMAAIAAGDIRLSQRNPQNTNYADVLFPTAPSSLIGTSGGGILSLVTIGSGLDLTAGVLTATGGGGGGAPTNATYITQTANASLSAEQALSLLSTGIMYVTTTTGVVSSLGPILPAANGGTTNAFTAFTGPTTSVKTFTLPNASATILTSATAVTVAQGGTGQSTFTDGQILIGNTTSTSLDRTTITAGTGITITNAPGSITINATGTGSGNVTNNATLTSGNVVVGGGSTVIGTSNMTWNGTRLDVPSLAILTTPLSVAFGGTGLSNGGGFNNGQLLIGNGVGFSNATITAGTGISITNGAGSITINATGSGSGNVTNSAPLTSGNIVVGGGTTVVSPSAITISANDMSIPGNLTVVGNQTIGNLITSSLNLTGNIVSTTVTDGQLFIGNGTGDRLQLAALTAGTGISITNGAGSITINATGSGSGNVTSSGTPTAGQAAQFSSATNIVGVTVVGSGNYVKDTAPTISAPTLSGIITTDGANVTTPNAMGAFAIDVTKGVNTKSISANQTFTFSGTPATANTWFAMKVRNTGVSDFTATIPSSKPFGAAAAITATVIPASTDVMLTWLYDGTTYWISANTSSAVNSLTEGQSIWITNTGGNATISNALKGLTTGGVVDNSAVIQAAFPAGVARNVILPKGDFLIATGITMAPGSTITGQGNSNGGTLITYSGAGAAFTIAGTSTTDYSLGGKFADLQINGTSTTESLITIEDLSRVVVERCTLALATTGKAIALKNTVYWCEETLLSGLQIISCRYHYYFDQNGGTNSYAHTRILGAQSVLTGVNDRIIYAEANSYIYRYDFEIGSNFEIPTASTPTGNKAALIELASTATILSGRINMYQELGFDRNFYRFILADNARIEGFGQVIIDPSTGMSASINETHPYDSINPSGAVVYIGPNGVMAPGTGNVNFPANLGAAQTVYAQATFGASANPAILYLYGGLTEVELAYIGPGASPTRIHTMKLVVATNKGADDATTSSKLTLVSDQASFGQRVFDAANPPTLGFSTGNNNAYLFVTINNGVSGGTLYVSATQKTFIGDIVGTNDQSGFQPIKFFPDVGAVTIGAVFTPARTAVTLGGNNTFTNGQILIGNTTSGNVDKATLTAGTGISITNGAGAITINATASGGTVTNTGGSLTADAVVLGAGTNDSKVVAGIRTDGGARVLLGVAGTSAGGVDFANGTSGSVALQTVTGALGTRNIALPAADGTVALTANKLSDFASTTSAELAGVVSNETGSSLLVFNTSPTLVTPVLGVATATSVNGQTITTGTGTITLGSNVLTVSQATTLNRQSSTGLPVEFAVAMSDETTAITTGTAKVTMRAPYAFTVTEVRSSLTTASSSGLPTVDINESGTTILSTKLTIDASEKTSTTAATPPVISDTAIADDAELTFDIDVAGTGATGLKVWIKGYR